MADLFDVSVGGMGWHLTTGLIALAALFVACFAITGYITYRKHSIPPEALDQTGDADDDVVFNDAKLTGGLDVALATVLNELTTKKAATFQDRVTHESDVTSKAAHSVEGTLSAAKIAHGSTTGVGRSLRDPARYYLEEYFAKRPALNAIMAGGDANQAGTTAEAIANKDFEVQGTSMTTALVTFPTTGAGILMTTAGAEQDQAIVTPHEDTNQSAWGKAGQWGTENEVVFETSILLPAIDNQKVWAGLKLTNDQLVATDADQAYFKFQTDADNSEAFTDFTVLHFVYSVAGTDYISALPVTVAANTPYHLKIEIDSNRQVAAFVNGTQYNLTNVAGSTGGTVVTAGNTRSLALTDDVDLIPYIGIEAGDGAAEALEVHYIAMSRSVTRA